MTAPHVLIVDDDPALLEALPAVLRLRMDGLTVDTSDSAAAALERIAETEYDAAVVDIKMPGMDGLQLLAEIKRVRADMPILLITGHGDHELAVQALRGGAHDYVTKPIDREYFVSSLSRAVQRQRLTRELARKRTELEQHAQELEECVRDRTNELRELLHRERTAHTELEEAKRTLEAANQQREEFILMIAHELGGPLSTVRGYAEMLSRPNASVETQERARKLIVAETGRIARLVQDLADTARAASATFELKTAPCDLVQIAREQVDLAAARSDQHVFRFDAPPELRVDCDRDRIAQILSNLLTNALKYSVGGEISVRLWREADQVRISVSDSGPGIPVESREAVFQPGHRLHTVSGDSQPAGAGLGLHIARAIVEAHGGQIWVNSESGQGAVFNVSLPVPAESCSQVSS